MLGENLKPDTRSLGKVDIMATRRPQLTSLTSWPTASFTEYLEQSWGKEHGNARLV
jgi:hypothetical protein